MEKFRSGFLQVILKFIVFAVAMFFLWLGVFKLFGAFDNDMIWHYMMGRDIHLNGISCENPYSWIKGTVWNQQEWLYDLIFYLVVEYGGMLGYILMAIIPLVVIYVVGIIYGVKEKSFLIYLLFYAAVYYFMPKNAISRPVWYSTLFLPILVLVYLKLQKTVKMAIIFFLSGILLSNMHLGQGEAIGIFLIICFMVDIVYGVMNKSFDPKYYAGRISGIILYFVGMFFNPVGIGMVIESFKMLLFGVSSEYNSLIKEWKPYSPDHLLKALFLVMVVFICGYGLSKFREKEDYIKIGLILASVLATFKSAKVGVISVMLIQVFLYPYLIDFVKWIAGNKIKFIDKYKPLNLYSVAGMIAGIVISINILLLKYPDSFCEFVDQSRALKISDEVIDYLKERKDCHLLNAYNNSNFLMWNDIKVMVDTRFFPYDYEDDEMNAIDAVISLDLTRGSSEEIKEVLEKFDIDTVFIDDELKPIEWYFKYSSKYELVVSDSFENAVYVRKE